MRQNYSFSKNSNALLEPCEGKLSCTVLRGESPSNGADLLDTEKQTFYGVSRTSPNHLQGFLFGKMTEDENGRIYLATEHGGLNCIDPHTGSIEHFDENTHQLPFHTTKSVWYDIERQRLYVGTFQKGLYEMDAQKHFKSIGSDYLDNESKRIVIDLLPWKEHLLVITQGGLYQLDLVTQELSPLFTGPDIQERMQGVVRAAYVDGSERLWLSFAARELICWDLRKKKQLPIDTLTTLVGNQAVQSITGDSHGNIYFSITGYGLLQYNPDTQRTKTFNREQGVLPSDEPFQLLALPNGHLLITSLHTLTWLDPQSGKSIRRLLNKISPLHLLNRNGGLYRASNGILYIGGIEGVLALHEEAFATPKGDYSFFIDEISVNNHPLTPSANITLPHDQNNLNIKFTATNYRYANPNAYEYKLEGLDKQWTRTNLRTITYTTLAPGRYKLWIREMNGDKQIQLAIRIMPPLYASPYALLLYILLGAIGIYWLVRSYRSRTALKHFLEQERQEKIHAEKLNQLKLKFYVDISHELRTPLTIIISLLDRLIQDNRLPALFRNRLEKIRTYTQQMEQLVSEVLDFRRLEQGKMPFNPELQDIKPFLHDLYDSFIPYAEVKKIHYRWEVSDESVKLWFDPVQLRKAINNLLANAFKFTPEGGSIRIHCIQQSDRIEIEISDTGCGIPEAQKKQIFERFYQANHTHAGSGIGLSLSREIILQHQGSIEVESKEGKGTTFRITLRLNNPPLSQKPEAVVPSPAFQEANRPLTPAEVATPALDEDETDHPHTDGEKRNSVLLIEDNPELLNILSEAFSLHYNIYTASDGETGRQLAETRLPDLIVSDVMMPNLSGIDLCRRLKERLDTAHIPIILLTARTDLASTLEGLKAGANDYILKPFNMEVLLLKCHNLTRALQARRQAFQNDMQASPTELTTNPLDQSLLEESIRIIEANLENKDFNIDFWCREIRIGRTRLNSKIKNITGLTLNDFILQIKLRKCSELLLDERLTLTDIAYQCGFSNASYMGKCFKEKFGMTPMQYRNNKGK